MPNVSLAADPKSERSLADLVAPPTTASSSPAAARGRIDHQRYNFQFSGQTFHEVKGGKIKGPLRDVAYQSNSLEFWRSCDCWRAEELGDQRHALGREGRAFAVERREPRLPSGGFRGVDIINVNARGAT